jgi:NTE family protein
MANLSAASKLNADWDFLTYLRDDGRKCAHDWLAQNFSKLNVETTVDIDRIYL